MRALSVRQATSCETAQTKRCRCRCGGLLHGANRVRALIPATLDDDDPHYAETPAERRLNLKLRQGLARDADAIPAELPGQEPFEWFGSEERAAARAALGAAP